MKKEETQIILERHEQKIQTMKRDISDLKATQNEFRSISETLIPLASKLKHTNGRLASHDRKIDETENKIFHCTKNLQ